jgi:hypothetical protein
MLEGSAQSALKGLASAVGDPLGAWVLGGAHVWTSSTTRPRKAAACNP